MKLDNNFEHFDRAKLIAGVLADMAAKREVDHEIVTAWLEEDETAIELLKKLSDESDVEGVYSEFHEIDEQVEKSKVKLMNHVAKRRRVKRQRIILKSAISSCAAALLIVSLLLYNNNQDANVNDLAHYAEKVEKPTLILSSGKSVSLKMEGESVVENTMVVNVDKKGLSYKNDTSGNITKDELFHRLVIPRLQIYNLTLSDGTIISINANSEIYYPTTFKEGTRKVYLKGEAYFKVAKDTKPFIVNIEGVDVRVYGTEFNINAHIENYIYTTLISGSVGVTVSGCEEVTMKPNQLSVVNLSDGSLQLSNVNVSQYISWMDGDFIYEDADVNMMINDVAAWYGVEICYDKNLFDEITINAAFSRKEPLAKILKSIEEITDVKFIKISQNKYAIE